MSRIAYVDGQYVPHRLAQVPIEDRGYQFADGVYEVCAVFNARILDEDPHLDRLERSLNEIRIPSPMPRKALSFAMAELVRRNRVRNGMIYLQVTRGVARRDHPFPKDARPMLVMTAKSMDFAQVIARAEKGVKVMTHADMRWSRCDVKTVGLLPNVLAKQAAREAGAYEAWLVDRDGYVTEGSSTNAWIVNGDGVLVTRPLANDILPGITRQGLIALARERQIRVEERPFTVDEALSAKEAFFTSTTAFAMPVVSIDGKTIGDGKPGPVTRRLISLYWEKVMAETGLRRSDLPAIPA